MWVNTSRWLAGMYVSGWFVIKTVVIWQLLPNQSRHQARVRCIWSCSLAFMCQNTIKRQNICKSNHHVLFRWIRRVPCRQNSCWWLVCLAAVVEDGRLMGCPFAIDESKRSACATRGKRRERTSQSIQIYWNRWYLSFIFLCPNIFFPCVKLLVK